jgi:hypothetical protein
VVSETRPCLTPRCTRHVADELGSAARTITTEGRRFLSEHGERVLRNVIALVSHPQMTNADRGWSGSTYVRFVGELLLGVRTMSRALWVSGAAARSEMMVA